MTIDEILKRTGSKSQRDLAQKLNVSQNCVWGWARRGRVSGDGAIALEKLTKGKIKASELRGIELE